MVATYTPNARLTKQGVDDNPNTWGVVVNEQVIELIDEMVMGIADVDITGSSNVTLTTQNGDTDQARHAGLELTGVLGADIELIIPAAEKLYVVRGAWTGDFTVTIKITGSATSIDLTTGTIKFVYTNGTDIYLIVDEASNLKVLNNLSDLDNAATARTNLGIGALAEFTGSTTNSLVSFDSSNEAAEVLSSGTLSINGDAGTIDVSDASTSQKGVIEIATDAEFAAATETNKAVVPSNFTTDASANGYIKLPGGIIMQWGSAPDSVLSTFPLEFPNACFSLVAIPEAAGGMNTSNPTVEIVSTTQFYVREGTNTGGPNLNWIAIGN